MNRSVLRLAVMLSALTVLLLGCSGASTGEAVAGRSATAQPSPTSAPEPAATPEPTPMPEPTSTPEPAATPEPTPMPEPTSTSALVQSLDRLPATVSLTSDGPIISDLKLAREQSGIVLPDDCGPEAATRDDFLALYQGPGLFAPELERIISGTSDGSLERAFGLRWCDIDSVARGASSLEFALTVWGNDVAPESIEEGLRADPVWSSELTVVNEQPEQQYFAWGAAPQDINLEFRTGIRNLGQGGYLLVRDGYVIRATAPDGLDDLVAGSKLSDVEAVAEVVQALADENVHSLFLEVPRPTSNLGSPRLLASEDDIRAEFERRAQVIAQLPSLTGYPLFGVGVGFDVSTQNQFLSVVMFNLTPEVAVENTEKFRLMVEQGLSLDEELGPWADHFTIRSSETRDRLSIIGLEATNPDVALMSTAHNARFADTLFAWSPSSEDATDS